MKKYFNLQFLWVSCFVAVSIAANAQRLEWANNMGGSNMSAQHSRAVTVDGGGNTYIIGDFQEGPADFDPGPGTENLLGVGERDIYIAKYDKDGNYVWAKSIGGKVTVMGIDIVTDELNNVYVYGRFTDTADFDPGPGMANLPATPGAIHTFLAKYDSNGNYIWAKGFGDDVLGLRIVYEAQNVYVVGVFGGTVNFDPGSGTANLISTGTTRDMFFAKYDSAGNYVWAKSIGGIQANNEVMDIALDGSGYLYLTGYFTNTVDFDPGSGTTNLTSTGRSSDAFLAKYDTSGKYVWVKQIECTYDVSGRNLAMDQAGNIYLGGTFRDTMDANPGSGVASLTTIRTLPNTYISRYDSAGNYIWAKNIESSGTSNAQVIMSGIDVDRVGNVYFTGTFRDSVDFDPGPGTYYLNTDIVTDTVRPIPLIVIRRPLTAYYITKLDSAGNFVWVRSTKNLAKSDSQGEDLVLDKSGNIYATGYFSQRADFNPDDKNVILISGGVADVFLLKLGCNDTTSTYLSAISYCGEGYTFADTVYTNSGIYTVIYPNKAGCDSTVILDLTILYMDKPVINVDSFTLGVTGTYATYQWLFGDELIEGAKEGTYTVTENGSYRVIVTDEHGCIDTSDIYIVKNVSINDAGYGLHNNINIYPNPAHERVYIQSPVKVNVRVTDMAGRVMGEWFNATSIPVGTLTQGMYLLNITDEKGAQLKMEKLVKAE